MGRVKEGLPGGLEGGGTEAATGKGGTGPRKQKHCFPIPGVGGATPFVKDGSFSSLLSAVWFGQEPQFIPL